MLVEKNPSLAGKSFSIPVVTQALTHGLHLAGKMFLNPGEALLLPDLFWGNYRLLFEVGLEADLHTFNTFRDGGLDLEAFQSALASIPGEKITVLLNFPNNPTGYSPTPEEADQMLAILKAEADRRHVVAFIDDAYFGFVYEDGVYRESLFAKLVDAHENLLAVKLDGPTKEDYVWGWRVGFMTLGIRGGDRPLYESMEAKLGGAIRGSISNVTALGQNLLLQAFQDARYEAEKKRNYAVLKERYQRVRDLLAEHPEYSEAFEALPFNAGYFMCLRVKGTTSEQVRQILLRDYSCGVIAMGNDLLRIAYSSVSADKIETLFANLHAAVKKATST
ncbi:MAG: aminotransferase class I/II-fold pyridoxal phosphate-dependent enzyme [Lentisphaerae bacterium]|nr:MAG: aminotransferase class I/II-fold pyridoxal phosphate-dependent enzyme [Lentisphaerota bacterium]